MNKTIQKLTLSELLLKVEELDYGLALFTERNEPLHQNTVVYVADPDEHQIVEVDGKKYIYHLSVQSLQGIVFNAKEQKPQASVEELVQAFIYYLQNDAFIEFNR